jgi:hypothetical protein
MENEIRVQFTYDIADDQYYTTNDLKQTATAYYVGPAKQYWQIEVATDRWTGSHVSYEVHQTFNERLDDGFYSVEIDCATNPLLCSLASTPYLDRSNWPTSSEEIPESEPYVRDNPATPDHTYEKTTIFYDKEKGEFKPLAWKTSILDWDVRIKNRDSELRSADTHLSEDLPTALYNKMVEYKQYLRDFTTIFGVSWFVTIDNGGSGYAVGDRLAISDSRLKAGVSTDDVMLTVTEVSNGSITAVKTSGSRAFHIKEAISISDVYFTTNGGGTGARFTASKNKLIDPWKIAPKQNPLV